MSLGLFMLYLLFVYRSTLQGLGDTIIPMVSGIVELAMRIGCVLLLPLLIGEWGVYIAEISAWIGAAILLIWGYYHRDAPPACTPSHRIGCCPVILHFVSCAPVYARQGRIFYNFLPCTVPVHVIIIKKAPGRRVAQGDRRRFTK